ncbi:MAG: hypothetical protein ACRD3T_21180 [Terriglobia bacterium]
MNKQDGPSEESSLAHPLESSAHTAAQIPSGPNPAAILEKAERNLMLRVYEECHVHIIAALADSPIPPELVGGLTANESGGIAQARRFEPGVFEHLKDVADGRSAQYGAIRATDLEEAERALEAVKSPEYHARFLNTVFAATHALSIAELQEDALRALASSWGYTQVMGYHMIGRKGTIQDLCNPDTHYRYAVDLLRDFIREFRLDARKDFESLFHCWNSGRPRGKTFDPAYVPNGLRRSAIYRELMPEPKAARILQAAGQRPSSQAAINPAGRDPQNT